MKSFTRRLDAEASDKSVQSDLSPTPLSSQPIEEAQTMALKEESASSSIFSENSMIISPFLQPSSNKALMWMLGVFGLLMAAAALIYCVQNLFALWMPKTSIWTSASWPPFVIVWALLIAALSALTWYALRPLVAAFESRNPDAFADRLNDLSLYVARSVFWAILLVGLVEIALALPSVLGDYMDDVFGKVLGAELIKQDFRGPFVHFPLIFLGFVLGAFLHGPHFIWLSFLIVLAELTSAVAANVFNFTNVFIGDLVRMWYVGLFLLSAGYTLIEGGHVRVDVLYAGLGARAKNWVNFLGCFVFGLPLAWVILAIGARGSRTAINGALASLDKGPSGAGLLTQYFLAFIFMSMACILVIQFSAYLVTYGGRLLGRQINTEQGSAD